MACLELDSFVARTLEVLDPQGVELQALREKKLAYYLCDGATVNQLTGYPTMGMADLTGRAVISSHFPHFHELAHLLVHILMKEKPSQTHPLVQEGMACLLGGRWGRAPKTILFTGWVHRHFGMGDMGGVLTRDGFNSTGADVAYPLGAILCETVRRNAGWGGVLELNGRLSGTAEFVSALTKEDLEKILDEICGWDEGLAGAGLENALGDIWPELQRCGIYPTASIPTDQPIRELAAAHTEVKIWNRETSQIISLKSDRYPVYLLTPKRATGRAFSSLFQDHLPEIQYLGQRYALRCGPDSISLYDYATNQLLATWVASFTDEVDACGNRETGLVFEVDHHGAAGQETTGMIWDFVVEPQHPDDG